MKNCWLGVENFREIRVIYEIGSCRSGKNEMQHKNSGIF